ncbi:MAG: CbiQ family ECF transporter T component, partial [Coriobacteriia bacterium]
MRIPVTFGQYVPVASAVHALDAKAKMGLVAAFTTAVFLVEGFAGLAVMACFVAAAIALARVPAMVALRGIKALAFLLSFTLVANAVRWEPATVSLVRVGPLALDGPGILDGVFFASRVVLLVVGTSLLTLTTTPVQLTDGLERVMRPLRAIGV